MRKLLEHPIISAVVASLIVSGLTWISGYIPAASQIQEWFTTDIEVPAWAGLFFVLLLAFSLLLLFIGPRNARSGTEASKHILTDREAMCLAAHVGLGENQGVVPSGVAKALKIHIEEARHVLETLQENYYIHFKFHTDNGEEATGLTEKGREYVVENGLLPSREA